MNNDVFVYAILRLLVRATLPGSGAIELSSGSKTSISSSPKFDGFLGGFESDRGGRREFPLWLLLLYGDLDAELREGDLCERVLPSSFLLIDLDLEWCISRSMD